MLFDAGQIEQPHDHLPARQQNGRRQVVQTQAADESGVFGAPFRRGPFFEARNSQAAQNFHPARPHARRRHLQIALQHPYAYAGPGRRQPTEVHISSFGQRRSCQRNTWNPAPWAALRKVTVAPTVRTAAESLPSGIRRRAVERSR